VAADVSASRPKTPAHLTRAAWNYIMAASTIVALPMLTIFVIFQRRIIESIKTTGLK
jgi:ABC-type glycerol-3-phosphate transport system permease component